MSWEDQGRQEHGWSGHGTSRSGLGAKGLPERGELRSRMAAVVEFAAALLKQQRNGAPDRLRRSLDTLRELVPTLAQSVHFPADVFRHTFLGKSADPQVAWSLQRMVSAVVHADSHAGLKRAGEDLASAVHTVGMDDWTQTLQTAQASADRGRGAKPEAGAGASAIGSVLHALNPIATAEAAGTKNPLRPDPNALGEHSTFRRGPSGKVEHYETYERNPVTGGFDPKIRFRGVGKAHGRLEPPLLYERSTGKGPGSTPDAARAALPSELPAEVTPPSLPALPPAVIPASPGVPEIPLPELPPGPLLDIP